MERLVGLVFAVALYAILMGSRHRRRDVPARPWVGSHEEPRLEPWPYATVPGLVQPELTNRPHLRMLIELLKEKWRGGEAHGKSPEAVMAVLCDMAATGASRCARLGVPEVGDRFRLLRDRLRSRSGEERAISDAEAQAAKQEIVLLMNTLCAMVARRYVG